MAKRFLKVTICDEQGIVLEHFIVLNAHQQTQNALAADVRERVERQFIVNDAEVK